jgi:mono/diheme cytochrome c family protein
VEEDAMTWQYIARPACPLLMLASLLIPCSTLAAEDGAALFNAKCAPCHGKDGRGKVSTKAADLLSEKVRAMTEADIKDLIASRANGELEKSPMHTFQKKRITDEQRNAIVAHIRELQKKSH